MNDLLGRAYVRADYGFAEGHRLDEHDAEALPFGFVTADLGPGWQGKNVTAAVEGGQFGIADLPREDDILFYPQAVG